MKVSFGFNVNGNEGFDHKNGQRDADTLKIDTMNFHKVCDRSMNKRNIIKVSGKSIKDHAIKECDKETTFWSIITKWHMDVSKRN